VHCSLAAKVEIASMRKYSNAIRQSSTLSSFKQRRRAIAAMIFCIALCYATLWRGVGLVDSPTSAAVPQSKPSPTVHFTEGLITTRRTVVNVTEGAAPQFYSDVSSALHAHYLGFPGDIHTRQELLASWSPLIDLAASMFAAGRPPSPLPAGHSSHFFVAAIPAHRQPSSYNDSHAAFMDSGVLLTIGRLGDQASRCRSSDGASELPFTKSSDTNALVLSLFGPDWFEASVVFHGNAEPSSNVGPLASVMFVYDPTRCLYVASQLIETPPFSADMKWTAVLLVDHLHDRWNAFRETQEEAHYNYVLHRVSPVQVAASGRAEFAEVPITWENTRGGGAWVFKSSNLWPFSANTVQPPAATAGPSPSRWFSIGKDPIEQYHTSALKGYWLSYKSMKWSDYGKIPNYQYDFLGRMNYGVQYAWQPPPPASGDEEVAPAVIAGTAPLVPVSATREEVLSLLRNRVVYFFGDSHMRIFFYGFLTRLGVLYPLDKVWRGDRTDHIASHNVTVKFVASYFLNFSRPSAVEMMTDASTPIVVAGVGQHHSCHCWAVDKHASVVRDALLELSTRSATSPRSAARAAWRRARHIVWFGIPAQPFNTHLYRPKPVGQARKDCRNNARHALYSAHHIAAIRDATRQRIKSLTNPIVFLDTFFSSFGQQHTSLDGAHYYTWVREAWIDQLVHAVRTFR
jgi:hypothetical protein